MHEQELEKASVKIPNLERMTSVYDLFLPMNADGFLMMCMKRTRINFCVRKPAYQQWFRGSGTPGH